MKTIQSSQVRRCNQTAGIGFTIIELVITIAVAGILVAIAIPNFTETIKNNRLVTRTNGIVEAINVARQTAISRSITTMVCHTADANVATPSCGGAGSGWNTGNIVYAVQPRTIVASERAYASANDSLVQKAVLGDGDGIAAVEANAADYISFTSRGLLFSPNEIKIVLCDDRSGEIGRTITVSRAGRIATNAATGADACS